MTDVAMPERAGVLLKRGRASEPRVSLIVAAMAGDIPERGLRHWMTAGFAWVEADNDRPGYAKSWRGFTLRDCIGLSLQGRLVYDLGLAVEVARDHLAGAFRGHFLSAAQPSKGDEVAKRLGELQRRALVVTWDNARLVGSSIEKISRGGLSPLPTMGIILQLEPIIAATLARLKANTRGVERSFLG